MPTVALTPLDVEWAAGTVDRLSTVASGADTEVWLTGKDGGARIVRIPTVSDDVLAPDGRPVADKVRWARKVGANDTGSFELARYAKDGDDNYWLSLIEQWTADVQIVHGGVVRVWGPVQTRPVVFGAPRVRIDVLGAGYRLGTKMMTPADTVWSLNRVRNPQFTNGWSHWSPSSGPGAGSLDAGKFETGTQSVKLDAGEGVRQSLRIGISANYDARLRARVWVDAGITTAVLRIERDGLQQTIRGRAAISADTPRGQWVWLVLDVRVVNAGTLLPAEPDVIVDGITGTGSVWVDRVELQIRPESLGLPQRAPVAGWLSPSLAAATIIATAGDDLNMSTLTDPTNDGEDIAAEWIVTPMRASEALRIAAEQSGQEQRWLYTPTARILEAKTLVGTEHDPTSVTLRPVAGEGAGTRGNIAGLEDPQGAGVPAPVTRVIARSEDGFTDSAQDLSGFGGAVFEKLVQAPVGVTDLALFAQAELRASNEDTTVYSLAITDPDLIGVLDIYDRVKLVASDGPDVVDRWVRIEALEVEPGAAVPMTVQASPWVEPDSGLKVPRGAKARTWQSTSDELTFQGRRLNDVERRLTDTKGVERFDELLDVAAVDADAPDDGDVPIYDAARERWVPGPAAGGTGGYATARATGDTTPDSWLDWSEASDPTWEPTLYAGGLATDVCGGIVVAEPGFYDVAVVGVSEDAFTIEAFSDSTAGGWQWASEADEVPPFCRSNLKIMEGADAGDGGASGSIQMALPADHRVLVRIVTAGFVEWSLSLELVAPADIVDGTCGE